MPLVKGMLTGSIDEVGNKPREIEKSKCSHTLFYFQNLVSNFCFRFPNLSLETLPLDDVRPLTNWPLSVMTTEAAGPAWARELPVALFPFLDSPPVPASPLLPGKYRHSEKRWSVSLASARAMAGGSPSQGRYNTAAAVGCRRILQTR